MLQATLKHWLILQHRKTQLTDNALIMLAEEENTEAAAPQVNDDVSAEDLSDWLDRTKTSVLKVAINDAQTDTSIRPVTTYAVTSECPGNPHLNTTVRRRYSDFTFLFDLLKKRYSGMILPVLPEKKAMFKGERFIVVRMRGLNRWFQRLLEIPFLKSDAAVQEFLSVEGGENDSFETIKKNWLEDSETNWLDRPHIRRWRDQLSLYSLTDNCDGIIADSAERFSMQVQSLAKFAASLNSTVPKINTQGTASDAFMNATSNAETASFTALEKYDDDSGIPDDVITAIRGVGGIWHELTATYQNISSITKGGAARIYADLFLVEIKEAIAAYKHALDVISTLKAFRYNLTSAENRSISYKASLEKLREKRGEQDPKVEACAENIRIETEKIASFRAEILAVQKGLTCSQLASFAAQQAVDTKRLLVNAAAVQAAIASRRCSVWNKLAQAALEE